MDDVVRSIDELRQSIGGWDWFGFVSSLIGTFVGAVLAGGVALWVLRRQRRDRYEERIENATRRAVEELVSYRELRTADSRREGDVEAASQRSAAALLMLAAICDENDRAVIQACRSLSKDIKKVPTNESVNRPLTQLIGFVARMVSRDRTVADQLDAITLERRRLADLPTAEAGNSRKDI